MFTDMVGYTALGQRDESLSLELVQEQRAIIRPLLMRYNGREVKTIGDAFMVEFANALDAARCAFDIQRSIKEYNISAPEDRRLKLRIGLHLGDVSEDGDDISGDAVNLASRIEPLSEEGGVCLTRQVYDQVRNKLDVKMVSMGSKSLKNVSAPVEVFRMVMPWKSEGVPQPLTHDRSRLAVLPFANISPDPNDEYFADGLTEELISRLSLVRGLRVIARTSVMYYKKREKTISQIGEELGVGSIVEGSVRKVGNRIRVTAQLIDVPTEEHLWASTYDKNIDDIFAVQTDLASRIASSLPSSISITREVQKTGGGTTNVDAYINYLKAKRLAGEGTFESITRAMELLTEATKIDPSFARAYVEVGNLYAKLGMKAQISYDEGVKGMISAAKKALEIDENLAEGHALLSFTAWVLDDRPKDELEAEAAIRLNPNLAEAYLRLGIVRMAFGALKEAISIFESSRSLDPLSSDVLHSLASAYMYAKMDDAFLSLVSGFREVAPYVAASLMVSFYVYKGNFESAETELLTMEQISPKDQTTIFMRGLLRAYEGKVDDAKQAIRIMRERFSLGATTERNIGYIMLALGDNDAFLASMEKAHSEHVQDTSSLRYSPQFDKVRKDPRFTEIMRRHGEDPEPKWDS